MSGTSSDPLSKLPKGMRLLDGIPVPITVGGVEVQSVRLAADNPKDVHAGRTLLMLTNGTKLGGCVDCDFTHSHWSAVAGHREKKHDAPHAARKSSKRRAVSSAQQLELGAGPLDDTLPGGETTDSNDDSEPVSADGSVDSIDDFPGGDKNPAAAVLVPTAADVLPSASANGKVVHVPRGDVMLAMTLGELLGLAGQVVDAGAGLEKLREDRDKWKAEAMESRRRLRKLDTLLGKVDNVLHDNTKEED